MKRIKLIYTLTLLLPALFMATGCDKMKDFGDTNVNPGGTTSPSWRALLTNVEAGIGWLCSANKGRHLFSVFI